MRKYFAQPMPDCIIHFEAFAVKRGFVWLFCLFPDVTHTWQLPLNSHKTAPPPSFTVLLPLPHLLLTNPSLHFQFDYWKINISFSRELCHGREMQTASPFAPPPSPLLPCWDWDMLCPLGISNVIFSHLSNSGHEMSLLFTSVIAQPRNKFQASGLEEEWTQLLPSHSSNLNSIIHSWHSLTMKHFFIHNKNRSRTELRVFVCTCVTQFWNISKEKNQTNNQIPVYQQIK